MNSIPTTLSPVDLKRFYRDGYVVVKRAFSPDDARAMQDEWWAELADLHGIRRDDRATWRQPRGDLKRAKRSPIQTRFETPFVRGVLDDLLGPGTWSSPRHWGRVLTTFPQGGAWELPTKIWHSDSLYRWHRDGLNGAFVFSFVDSVAPRSGGTLIVAGSQHLLRRYDAALTGAVRRSGRLEPFFDLHPWFAALAGRAPSPRDRVASFMDTDTDIDGVRVRVVELTGEPGDIVFAHPSIIHSPNPNCGDRPRFMRIAGLMTHRGLRMRRGDRDVRGDRDMRNEGSPEMRRR